MFQTRPKPVALLILDGWGLAPASPANAVTLARTPNLDSYISDYPVATLGAAGEAVGLFSGQMGNSEVGHLSLGSGRVIYQNLPRISKAISDGSFFTKPEFLEACARVKKNHSSLHLLGLVSNGGVHSSNEHLYALLKLAKDQAVERVYIHVFLDGRDTLYNAGAEFVGQLEDKIKEIGIGQIATVSGRFYAMDRDNHWERIEGAYWALTAGESDFKFHSATEAIASSYQQGVYDEEFLPAVIVDKADQPVGLIKANDAVIFFNFRADRARELTTALVVSDFDRFSRPRPFLSDLYFVAMTEYEKELPVAVVFPPLEIVEPLAEVISQAGFKQLHIAETEKYAHVTFFFNGGREEKYEGEDRILVPSPRISSYDQQPKMSADKVLAEVSKEISQDQYDFIVLNFANPDMVGHTGNIQATIEALEFVDASVGKIVDSILAKNGLVIITADHGNAEEMLNLQTGEIDKGHSINPVPLYIIANELKGKAIVSGVTPENLYQQPPIGILADIAPTILKIMGLKKPAAMTGTSLI